MQLLNAGLNEDGYEAIQFAIDNTPFRESPFIAKNIILITDEGRSVIPPGEGRTEDRTAAVFTLRVMFPNSFNKHEINLLCCVLEKYGM